ncbi:MAG TPA: GreA/GreB family elongation factor, partial [Geobacteraceae bacterium]|nr:GreA/GreB family elongation factor [Geobacteraceae bacterium]
KLLKVAAPPANPHSVSFGCWVTYEDEDGNERCYQLVGADEFDVAAGRISVDSPVGQALLQKKVDDEVTIHRPSGVITVVITGIKGA